MRRTEVPLPYVSRPPFRPFRDTMWFYGLDPAAKIDYFGITINGLNPRPADGSPWLPFLRRTWQLKDKHYTRIIKWLQHEVFEAYPPTFGIMDATNDVMVAQEMEKVFGRLMIEARPMTNSMNYQLKQIGWRYMDDGYSWPNTAALKDRGQAETIRALKVECMEQYMVRTPEQKIKFVHPPNKHDDLNRSWEMSLLAVYEYQNGLIAMRNADWDDGPEAVDRTMATPSLLDDGPLGGSFALPYAADPLEGI